MIDAPSSTWFTAHPEWQWLVVTYFSLGALAGGSYFLAAMIDLFGRPEDRGIARRAYYVVFPMLLLIGAVLILDLSRPDRFWHLFVENHSFQPILKHWSPISVATWVLPVFGFLALLSLLGALSDAGRVRWRAASRLRPPGALGITIAGLGALVGLYLAAYPGVLLAVTNRPIWADTQLIGMLFVVSAVAMSAALMVLLGGPSRDHASGVRALHRTAMGTIVLQALVLAAVLVSLGGALRAWANQWGLVLLLGVVALGMVAPLLLERRRHVPGWHAFTAAAVLVLTGGILLRIVVVFSPQGIGQ